MVLPYTQVKYVFGTSAVSPALETYYGCIMGKATRLHDLVSHGWFPPKDDDCTPSIDKWLTYDDGAVRINPEGTDGAWAYPKFSKGNTVDIPTVRTYFKGGDSKPFKYVNLFCQMDEYGAIPYDATHFRIVRKLLTGPLAGKTITDETAVTPSAYLTVSEDKKTLSVVSTAPGFDDASNSLVMLPGTFKLVLELKSDDEEETDPISVTLTDKTATDSRINGTLYVTFAEGEEPVTYFKTGTKLKYQASTSDYAFRFDPASSITTVTGYTIEKVVSISYSYASYREAADADLLDGITDNDMFYLGKKDVADEDTELHALAASDSEVFVAEGNIYIIYAGTSLDDLPEEGTEEYDEFMDQLMAADGVITMPQVKEAFKNATAGSGGTIKAYKGGVVSSILKIDHASRIVTASYGAFDASDYAPFNGVAACACRNSSDKPMRVAVDVNPNTGAIRLDPGTITILGQEYEHTATGDTYIMAYDTDPDERPELPGADSLGSNFVCGYFRLEYEEKVTSNVMTGENGLYFTADYSTDGSGTSIEDLIGQMDPRNQLGFAYGLVKQLTTSDMYVLACTDLQNGTDTLEKYRNIFHVWYVSANGPEDAFYNWIDHENQKEQSRFRIGYQFKDIEDSVTRTDFISAVLRVDADDYYPYSLRQAGAGFSSELKVIPGDLVKDKNNPGTVLTVKNVSDDVLEFADPYIPTYFMEAVQYTPIGVDSQGLYDPFKVEYKAGDNGGRKLRAGTVRVRLNYAHRKLSNGTIISQDVWEGTLEDANEEFTGKLIVAAVPDSTETNWVFTASSVVPTEDPTTRWSITECSFDARYQSYTSDFEIYRIYTPMEKAERLAADQTSTNMACVTVLTRDITYEGKVLRDNLLGPDTAKILSTASAYAPASSYTKMPDYATPGLIFGTKLATQPHMPLTLVSFSLPGIGEVLGLREFSHDDLETLLDAGYCMINSEVGGLPYCETDCTVGYPMYGDSDRGLLSKITPVLMYGKDVYNVTKRWKGPMNTGTPELLSGLGTSLVILKKKYTETRYNLLGTLLKKVSDASISFDGSHILIDHHISSQDPARYIDNTVYVE